MSDKRLQMEVAKRIMKQKLHKLGQIMAITASDSRALLFYSFVFSYTLSWTANQSDLSHRRADQG